MSSSIITDGNRSANWCPVASEIAPDPYFRASVLAEALAGAYAFVANLLLLIAGWRALAIPPDQRLLSGHLSLILAWYGLGGVVKCSYLLAPGHCTRLAMSVRSCRILEVLTTNLAMVAMVLSIGAVCLERVFATWKYRGYEQQQRSRPPVLAIVSLVIIWIVALAFNLYPFATIPAGQMTSICDSSVFAPWSAIAPFILLYLVLEVAAVFQTILVHVYNKHVLRNMVINRALYDLSARFQVEQNVQMNSILLPSMILHLLCFVPNYALMLLFFEYDLSWRTKATLLHSSYLWRQVYAGAHPTLAFALNVRLRRRLIEMLGSNWILRMKSKTNRTTDLGVRSRREGDEHFRHLEEMWAGRRVVPGGMTIPRVVLTPPAAGGSGGETGVVVANVPDMEL